VVDLGEGHVDLDAKTLVERPALRNYEGRDVVVGVRPEDLEDARLAKERSERVLPATVDIREDMGSEVVVHFSVKAQPVRSEEVVAALEEEAVEALVERARREGVPFVARLDRQTQAREGDHIDLAVDAKRLHFFDPQLGTAIYDSVPS
jgi:multiple sugar transport system ATP-binding protein